MKKVILLCLILCMSFVTSSFAQEGNQAKGQVSVKSEQGEVNNDLFSVSLENPETKQAADTCSNCKVNKQKKVGTDPQKVNLQVKEMQKFRDDYNYAFLNPIEKSEITSLDEQNYILLESKDKKYIKLDKSKYVKLLIL